MTLLQEEDEEVEEFRKWMQEQQSKEESFQQEEESDDSSGGWMLMQHLTETEDDYVDDKEFQYEVDDFVATRVKMNGNTQSLKGTLEGSPASNLKWVL